MREVLFKAKRLADDGWAYGDLSQHKTGKKFIKAGSAIHSFEVDADTICQYTGLTDKNGNKIWENDVVQVPREDEYFRIEWDEDTASYVMNSNTLTVAFDNYWSHEVEVIGNIFDNAELLKGE